MFSSLSDNATFPLRALSLRRLYLWNRSKIWWSVNTQTRNAWSTNPSCNVRSTGSKVMSSPLSLKISFKRSVCFMLSEQIYRRYFRCRKSVKELATKSKFLWKMGCTEVSNDKRACGVPRALCPKSTRKNSRARTVNSAPSISFLDKFISSVCSPSYAFSAWGETASSCTAWIRSRTQSKSFPHSVASLSKKSRKQISAPSVPESSGTIQIESFFSFDNWVSTSNVRKLSISSPKKSIR